MLLTTLLWVSQVNGVARHVNGTVTRPDQQLEPLRALATNASIPFFPDTVGDVATMPGELVCCTSV